MSARTFEVPEHLLPTLLARLDRLRDRAHHLGCSPPTAEVVAWRMVETMTVVGAKRIHRVAVVEVTNPFVSAGAFALAARVEHTPNGNLLWAHDRAHTSHLARFRYAPAACDFCRTQRNRGDTFIVHNTRTGDLLQVGRDCMEIATGIRPEVADLAHTVAEMAAPDMGPSDTWPAGSHHYPTETVLAAAAALIRISGFVSAKKADEAAGILSTGRILSAALDGWRPIPGTPQAVLDVVSGNGPVADEDLAVARGTARMAAAIDRDTAGDFEGNVAVACGGDTTPCSAVGIACAAVSMYLRESEAARMATMGAVSGHFGAVGDKITASKLSKKDRDAGVTAHAPIAAEVVSVRAYDTMFGTMSLVKLMADSGHILTWRTKEPWVLRHRPGCPESRSIIWAGLRASVTGTIKAHGEYRGTPETEITRAKLVEL